MPKKILLFDDDFETMAPFMIMLKEHGYRVVLSAEEIILQKLSVEEFSLICIDLMIHPRTPNQENELVDNVGYPGVNWQDTGKEFVKRLRRGDYEAPQAGGTKSTVPLIVVSATSDMFDNGDEDFDVKIDDIYEKPFDAVKLLQRIRELVGEPG